MKFIGRILYEMFRFPIVGIWQLFGWRVSRQTIEEDKVILTGAPHTSNWDYMHFLITALYLRRKVYVTIKKELFFPPLGWILKWLGGIPIDRYSSHNLVDQLAERIAETDRMVLLFTPDGTRSYRPNWKSGFYWTAYEAGVPIRLGIPDYSKRYVYLEYSFMPSGDIEADFVKVRELQEKYGHGLYDEKSNPVITRATYEAQLIDEEVSKTPRDTQETSQAELSA